MPKWRSCSKPSHSTLESLSISVSSRSLRKSGARHAPSHVQKVERSTTESTTVQRAYRPYEVAAVAICGRLRVRKVPDRRECFSVDRKHR